ncbi:unnamed protein product [Prunus armeniaca]
MDGSHYYLTRQDVDFSSWQNLPESPIVKSQVERVENQRVNDDQDFSINYLKNRMEGEDEEGDEERVVAVQASRKGSMDMNGQMNKH